MNYSGSGQIGQIGQLVGSYVPQAQSGQAMPAPPPTLGSLIEALDGRISQGIDVLSHITKVADHFLGGMPRAVSATKESPEPNSMIDRLHQREQRLAYLLQEINSEISRLGNAL